MDGHCYDAPDGTFPHFSKVDELLAKVEVPGNKGKVRIHPSSLILF